MTPKKRLGRGLDALLSKPAAELTETAATEGDGLRQIPLDLLQRGQYQPRADIRQDTLEDLANSIRAQGVVQPIVARPIGERDGALDGERGEALDGALDGALGPRVRLQLLPALSFLPLSRFLPPLCLRFLLPLCLRFLLPLSLFPPSRFLPRSISLKASIMCCRITVLQPVL